MANGQADYEIDITTDTCPMTFVRVRLALDRMLPGETLHVRLRGDEPVNNVPRTAVQMGHEALSLTTHPDGISSLVLRCRR